MARPGRLRPPAPRHPDQLREADRREVLFTGYRDTDLPAVLQALDTFVLMGAGSDESCRAALDAMAAGRPVVARRVGALPDAVEHGVSGLLVDDERPESVEAALAALAGDPERARRMGEAGRRRADRASAGAPRGEVEAIYLEILARRAGARGILHSCRARLSSDAYWRPRDGGLERAGGSGPRLPQG